MNGKKYDLIIAGSGAAGLSAAIYAGRYKLKTLVVEGKEFGGQTAWAGAIENYPGAREVQGYQLMKTMKEQAKDVGVDFSSGVIVDVRKNERCFDINTETESYHCKTLIVALGSARRKLGVAGEERFAGNGVHYCITCDGPLYSGKRIAVVGGGDAAVKGASLAAEYADKIYMIVRGKEFRAEPLNKEKLKEIGDKIEILYETELEEIKGDNNVNGIILSREYNGSRTLSIDGLFIEIGSVPNTEPVKDLWLNLDADGHIEVDNKMETNVNGVYAAGDITCFFGHFKQIVTAASMGAMAATSAYHHCRGNIRSCEHSE